MSFVKISVIMAAYNVESYIDEAIQSVLAQKGVSFELLIGDDASTDGTWARIQKYQADPRVRAWRLRPHRGAAGVWNRLIASARGRVVSICDADDVMLPGHVRRFYGVMQHSPSVGVVYGDLLVEDHRKGYPWVYHPLPPSRTWDLFHLSCVWNPGTMIRRSLLKRICGYNEDLPFMVDCDLFLRLREITSFHHEKGRATYLYRFRRGSMSDRSPNDRSRVRRSILAMAILRRYGYRVPW